MFCGPVGVRWEGCAVQGRASSLARLPSSDVAQPTLDLTSCPCSQPTRVQPALAPLLSPFSPIDLLCELPHAPPSPHVLWSAPPSPTPLCCSNFTLTCPKCSSLPHLYSLCFDLTTLIPLLGAPPPSPIPLGCPPSTRTTSIRSKVHLKVYGKAHAQDLSAGAAGELEALMRQR